MIRPLNMNDDEIILMNIQQWMNHFEYSYDDVIQKWFWEDNTFLSNLKITFGEEVVYNNIKLLSPYRGVA